MKGVLDKVENEEHLEYSSVQNLQRKLQKKKKKQNIKAILEKIIEKKRIECWILIRVLKTENFSLDEQSETFCFILQMTNCHT